MAQTHTIAVKLFQIGANGLPKETHQSIDFRAWTAPVLRREGIHTEHLNIFISSAFYDAAQRRDASFMAGQARKMPFLSPAPIAIHNDGNVTRTRWSVLRRAGVSLYRGILFLSCQREEILHHGRFRPPGSPFPWLCRSYPSPRRSGR